MAGYLHAITNHEAPSVNLDYCFLTIQWNYPIEPSQWRRLRCFGTKRTRELAQQGREQRQTRFLVYSVSGKQSQKKLTTIFSQRHTACYRTSEDT